MKKEEEDCKQEEEEEKEKPVVVIASYVDLHAFIIAQNELVVMEDCHDGKVKEYQYLC